MSGAKDLGTEDIVSLTTDIKHIKQENVIEQETNTEREQTDVSRFSSTLAFRSLESGRKHRIPYLACQLNLTAEAYKQWKRIGSERGFSSDTDTACFLMQHYQDCMSGFQSAAACSVCCKPLALSCPKCKDSGDVAGFSVAPGHNLSNVPYCEGMNGRVVLPAAHHNGGSDSPDIDSKSAGPDYILSALSHSESVKSRVTLPAARLQQNNHASEHCANSPDSDSKSEDPDFTIKVKFAPSCARRKRGRPPKRAAAGKPHQTILPPDPIVSSAKPLLSSSLPLPSSSTLPTPRLSATTIITSAAMPTRHQKTRRFHRKPKRHKGVVSVSEAKAQKLRLDKDRLRPDARDNDGRVTGEEGQVMSISQEGKSIEELMQPGPGQRRGRKPTKNIKSVECLQCGARFTRKDALKVHMRVHTGERPYQCDMCAETFSLRASWVVHKRKHNNERPYVCKECGLTFNLAATLNQHIKLHSGVRPFLCSLCPKSFHRSGDLNTHMRSHTGFKPYLCQDCGKSFPISSDLNKHRILVHTDSKPFECQYCHKCFPFSHRLKTHLRIHTGEKDFLCTICGAKFAHKNNLTTHFRQHTVDESAHEDGLEDDPEPAQPVATHAREDDPGTGQPVATSTPSKTAKSSNSYHLCSDCGKAFRSISNLYEHQRCKHGNGRGARYTCERCGKGFQNKMHYTSHVNMHKNSKPFPCQTCGKCFQHEMCRNRHMAVCCFSAVKTLTCDICTKTFASQRYLNQHKETHDHEKRFRCQKCYQAYKHRTSLARHLKKNNCS